MTATEQTGLRSGPSEISSCWVGSGWLGSGWLSSYWVHFVRSETEARLAVPAREKRDQLEQQIEQLRQQQPKLEEDEYFDRLEPLFLEVAALYTTSDP